MCWSCFLLHLPCEADNAVVPVVTHSAQAHWLKQARYNQGTLNFCALSYKCMCEIICCLSSGSWRWNSLEWTATLHLMNRNITIMRWHAQHSHHFPSQQPCQVGWAERQHGPKRSQRCPWLKADLNSSLSYIWAGGFVKWETKQEDWVAFLPGVEKHPGQGWQSRGTFPALGWRGTNSPRVCPWW